MQYHLIGKEKTDHTYADRIRPRVQKHDYQVAMFGGSEPQTCQLFNPKGADCVFPDNPGYFEFCSIHGH